MKMCKSIVVVMACFSLLILPSLQGDSQAACSPAVQILGDAYIPTSIQDAYNYASTNIGNDFTLQLAGELFTEDLFLDGGNVVLDGGYDCSFASKTGTASGIFGTITIRGGAANFAGDVKVLSSAQCAFDIDGDGYTSIGSCSGTADDCNDNDPNINPGASEICDGIDNNCDSQIDEGAIPVDADGDGYYAIGSCGDSPYTDDCNDTDGTINPGALDIPYDGTDQDCNGTDLTFTEQGTCDICHSFDATTWDSLHAAVTAPAVIPPNPSCATCHNPEVGNILPGHYGNTVLTDGNNMTAGETIVCVSCHDLDETTHSYGGSIGTGTNFVWSKAMPVRGSVDCDTCHENRAVVHDDTAASHNNRIIDGTCVACHNSPVTGTLSSDNDVDELHRSDCSTCHNYTGTLVNAAIVREVIEEAVSGTPASCLACHTDKAEGHGSHDHTVAEGPGDLSYESPGQLCSSCHLATSWAEIIEEHNNSCATCHSSARQDVIDTIVAGVNPTNCIDCHADKYLTVHGNPDHVALGYVTIGVPVTPCMACHEAGDPVNGTVVTTHLNNCSLCHTTGKNLQPDIPAGGGDCVVCHITAPDPDETWKSIHNTNTPDHTNLVTVAGSTCDICHLDPPPLVESGNLENHNDCDSCHDADGGTISIAAGKKLATGGNCSTCHIDPWTTIHTNANTPNHITLVTVNGTGITGTGCEYCHLDPPPLVEADNPENHNSCGSCHNADGSLKVPQTFFPGGNCMTCHDTGFDNIHVAHAHTVAEGPGDLSYDPPGQLCSTCHQVSTWAEIEGTVHNVATNGAGSCNTCHNSARQEVINAIATGVDPTNCIDCHSGKLLTVHPDTDHVALGYVTGGATPCLNCHDTGAPVNGTVLTTHLNDCYLCHTAAIPELLPTVPAGGGDCAACHIIAPEPDETWTSIHSINTPDHINLVTVTGSTCALCHTNPPPLVDAGDMENHNDCSSCHDDDGGLIGIAAGQDFVTGGNCETCHITAPEPDETWEGIHDNPRLLDHSALVQVGTSYCADCHDDTLLANGTMPGADTHAGCASCHNTDGSLRSLAVGKDITVVGDCTTCHTGTWLPIHTQSPAPDHTSLVTIVGTTCGGSCHSDPPPLVDNADPKVHNGCVSCHDADNGTLQSSAFGKDFTTGGNCATCHTDLWETTHTLSPAPDHSSLVTVAGTGTTGTSCATCHDDTLLANGTLPGADTHTGCASCHNSSTGALQSSAIGKDFSIGGNCATCHDTGFDSLHTTYAATHAVSVGGDTSAGNSCDLCHDVTDWAQIEGVEHNVATNGAGSCNTCHNSTRQDVIDVIAAGVASTCLPCHPGKDVEHADHVAAGYVIGGVTPCLNCHDTGAAINGTVLTTHLNNCDLCHTAAIPELLSTVPTGGGDCVICHITYPDPNETWESLHSVTPPDHNPPVTVAGTTCSLCHNDPPPLVDAGDLENHNACGSCHDANGGLIGLAVGQTFSGGNCSSCHLDAWEPTHNNPNIPDHSSLVNVGATACANCHDNTFISAASNTHDGCSNCHNADGGLISSAIGKDFGTGGDCTTCHGTDWGTLHPTAPDHSALVTTTGTDNCASCHENALSGPTATTHLEDCSNCHSSADGSLVATYGTDQQTFAAGGNCETCHTTGWEAAHTPAPTHSALVQVATTSCAGCHNDTPLTSADPDTHDGCASCHNANGSLVTTNNTDQQSFDTGGDCTTCHGAIWGAAHPTAPDHSALVTTTGTDNCASCHENALSGPTATTHLEDCSNCHSISNGSLVPTNNTDQQTFAAGGNCETCHTTDWEPAHTSSTPSHATLVQVGASDCGGCHDDTLLADPGQLGTDTHLGCSSCHNTNGSLTSIADGKDFTTGGDCSTCHGSIWNTIHSGSCSTCHGGGTNGSFGANYWPDASSGNTANDAPGRHKEHIDFLAQAKWGYDSTTLLNQADQHDKQVDLCGYCHGDPGGVTHGNAATETAFANIWNKAADADGIIVGGSCSNINCHNNKTTGTGTYGWFAAGTSTCVMCHTTGGANSATTANPSSGLHNLTAANTTAHDDGFGSGDVFGCEGCHVKANISNHIDGVAKSADYTGAEVGVDVTTMYTDAGGTAATRGSCLGTSALGSCHTDGGNWQRQWSTDANVDIVANPDPGQAVCNVCHGQYASLTAGSGWSEGTSHAGVFGGTTNEKGRLHDGDDGSDAQACEDCHAYQYLQASNKHLDGFVTINDDIATVGDVDFTVDSANGNRVYCDACHNSDGEPTTDNTHTFPEGDLPFEQIAGAAPPTMTCFAGAAGCHGDNVDYWWPSDPSIDPSVYPNRAGAHPQHNITIGTEIAKYDPTKGGTIPAGTYNTTDNPRPPDNYDFNRTCVYCHSTKAFHVVGSETIPADVYQDGQPGNQDPTDKFIFTLDDPNNPGSWYPLDPDGTYSPFDFNDRINKPGTCSNIDCHSNAPYTPHWYGDFVKPGGVTSLMASTHNTAGPHVDGETDDPGTVYLTWNAPGDDGDLDGTAYRYEVRYSTSPINETNFSSATLAGNPPTVLRKGEAQEMVVESLTPGTDYYFAVRTYDETYLASEAQNVSDVVATSTAVTAHVDDVKPIFWGLDKTEGHDSEGVVNLSWGAAKDHTLPITYKVWWSTYSLKNHLNRGGTLPNTQTSYTEDSGGGAPTEGGSDYTIYTGSTTALAYQVKNLDPGVLYNFVVHAADGSPAQNIDANCICGLALVNTPPKETETTKLYSLSGTSLLVSQADPANPDWGLVTTGTIDLADTSSFAFTAGTDLDDDVTGNSISRDFWVKGISLELFVENNDRKYPQTFSLEVGYDDGSFNSLGAPVEIGIGRRSSRVMKISLSAFDGTVPANANLTFIIRRVNNTLSAKDITFAWGDDTNKGQLIVNAQAVNHPPTAPSGISATRTTAGYVDISWSPSDDGESSINQTLHYDVYGSADGGATYPYVIGTKLTDADAVAGITWDTVGDGLTGTSYTAKVKIEASDGYMFEENTIGSGISSPGSGIWGSHVAATSNAFTLDNTADEEAPAPVTFTTSETRPKKGTVYLEWLAVGNDGYNHGTRASYYDIRYSPTSAPITDETSFATAEQAWGEPAPNFAGFQDRFELVGLIPDIDYTIAIKACDDGEDTIKGSSDDNCSTLGAGSIVTEKGGQNVCGICHSTPPDDPATAGTHRAHGYTLNDCAKCHGEEVLNYTVRHYDGLVQIGWAENADGSRAPLAELSTGSGGSGVTVTQTTDNNGDVVIYQDPDGAGGFNAAVTYNPGAPLENTDSGSCMNFIGANANGCHGPFDPKWASDTVATKAAPTCADCHGDKTAARNTDPYGRIWDDVNDLNEPSDQVKAAPPQANHAGTETTDRYVGAHERHLNASFRFAKEDSCRLCHRDTFETGLHANKSNDIVFDYAANESETVAAVADNTLPDVDIKGISCSSLNNLYCHDTGARWAEPGAKCSSCHGMNDMVTIPHISDGGTEQECNYCHMEGHPQSPDGVNPGDAAAILINNNPAVGINYRSGGIHMRLVIGGRSHMNDGEPIDTLAEMCWGCHEDQTPIISEWGTNTAAMTGSSGYDYGTLDRTSWVGAVWTSAKPEFAYKTGYIQSIHTTDPSGTSAVNYDAANGRYNETIDAADKIRCSNCHDVHDLNKAPGDTMTGRPYLRGTWMGNPYEEDGAPYDKTYTSQTIFGAVPRGGTAYNELGGYYIDQNNIAPGTTTPDHYPTSGWTLEFSAGLCTLCHGTDVNEMDQLTGENLWLGTNGHSNSALGGNFTNAANIFDYSHGRPSPVGYDWGGGRPRDTNHYSVQVPDTAYMYQGENYLAGGGYRGPDANAGGYSPPLLDGQPYAFNLYDWGATSDADTTDVMYHQFSCSKCHNPHASRLPKLMITNCLDIRHNTWDESNSSQQNTFTASALNDVDRGKYAANYASAQNCHRYDDSRSTEQLRGGWNKVTPWKNENINDTAHP